MNKSEIGILVVDDELIVRESLTKWFREDGFRVDSAENAAVALKKLQAGWLHLMLVDIKMPGMDGIELLQRVREINKNIVVIIITAFASVDTAVKALKEGAYDYITKPIDPDYLDHLIDKALEAAGAGSGEREAAPRSERADRPVERSSANRPKWPRCSSWSTRSR